MRTGGMPSTNDLIEIKLILVVVKSGLESVS